MCQNTCNSGDTTNDPQDVIRPGHCNDGGTGDANALAELCELGTDCDDCGIRLFCYDCPMSCQERNWQLPREACMQEMWNDGKCDPNCNNFACDFNECTTAQIAEECLKAQRKSGIDASGPPDYPSVAVLMTPTKPQMGIDSRTNTMRYTSTIFYKLQWSDPRLTTSPCLPALPRMLSRPGSDAGKPSPELASFWVPDPIVENGVGDSNIAAGTGVISVDSSNLTKTSIRNQVLVQDFSFVYYPFDWHVIEFDISVNDAVLDCEATAVHLRTLPTKDLIPISSSPWVLRSSPEKAITAITFVDEEGVSDTSRCVVQIEISRNAIVYLVTNLIPLIVIGLGALLVLQVNPSAIAPRYSVLIFGMVLISLKSNTELGLGKLTYLIWVDYLKTVQFVILLCALAETALIHRLTRDDRTGRAKSIDQTARFLFPVVIYPVFVIAMVIIGVSNSPWGGLGILIAGVVMALIYGAFRIYRYSTFVNRRQKYVALKMNEIESTKNMDDMSKVIEEAFTLFDLDKSGTLEQREQNRMMATLYPNKTRMQIAEDLDKMNLRESASMDEFALAMKRHLTDPKDEEVAYLSVVPSGSSKKKADDDSLGASVDA